MDQKEMINELNALRLKTERNLIIFIISVIVGAILLLIGIIPSLMTSNGGAQLIFFFIFGAGGIIAIGKRAIVKNYRSTFKTKLLPIAMKQFGENISYTEEGLSQNDASVTGMFGRFSVFKSEDTIKGKVVDVNFRSSDVRLGYYTGSGKHRRYVPVCHGQLYIFDFNKRFRTNTIIREKSGRPSASLERIELENIEFNEKFNIFTNNQHDAFYILTPHFMEKLLTLERNHPGVMFMAFYHNQLYLGIHNNKDRFEPPLFEPITNHTITSQLRDLILIKNMVEELKLNQRIFID